jgi:hypothetical protein
MDYRDAELYDGLFKELCAIVKLHIQNNDPMSSRMLIERLDNVGRKIDRVRKRMETDDFHNEMIGHADEAMGYKY